jgi:putative membrane protein
MLIARWLISAAAIALVAWLMPGIHAGEGTRGVITVGVASLFLGLANALVKPVLVFLSCPLIVLTLGLLLFIINAAMLMLASWASGLVGYPLLVDGWGSALIGSILITIVTWFLSLFVREKKRDKARLEP